MVKTHRGWREKLANGARTRKSWREKLADSKGLPKVERIIGKMSKRWGTGTVVISAHCLI